MTKKLGLIASILTPISCGLAIAPFSVSSSHFCCSSTRSVFGYHGTSFSLADGGKAFGMCMTANEYSQNLSQFSSSWEQTGFEIQFYIGIHLSGIDFGCFGDLSAMSPSPTPH